MYQKEIDNMSTLSLKVGMILRYARTKQRMTLEQVAIKLNKTKATISRWEKGEREFNVTDLNRYLDAINMTGKDRERIGLLVVYCDDIDALLNIGFTRDELEEIFG